jgi:4-hydroxy-tetrahydrodipicolinate synthase
MQIKGLITAIVTPFNGGKIDCDTLNHLVDIQLEAKVDGIAPVGTTGESPTLKPEEHLKVIETVVKRVSGRCLVIAGTGANSTCEAIHLTKEAKAIGANASLQVTPYYNKPTQEGLYRHFSMVADLGLPIVLYNVPGRTGTAIAVSTIERLSKNPNIVAIKEAGGNVDRVSEILDLCDITVLSGDDSLTLPMMALGSKGIISVASNLYPKPLKQMVDYMLRGDLESAKKIHYKLYNFMRDIFVETNPVPIKAAMARKGLIKEEYRLPLCELQESSREILYAAMDKAEGETKLQHKQWQCLRNFEC